MTNESHTDCYPALKTAISKLEDQKREIERLTRERDVSRAAIDQLHAAVKTAQELAATRLMEIERLKDALKRVRRVAAEGTTHTGMIAALGILVDRTLNPGNGPLPPDYTYHSHEPCEQRGPFAGLQSLSFDVSENPTIALVMRFDNIEHAQAARDQLWQPAGASRDASSEKSETVKDSCGPGCAMGANRPAQKSDEIRDLACCDKFVRESASEFCAICGYTNLDHLRKRSSSRTSE